jgi:hypothetical protein
MADGIAHEKLAVGRPEVVEAADDEEAPARRYRLV